MVKITDGFRHISDISKYNYNAMNKKIKTSFKSTPILVFRHEKPSFATRLVKFFKALFYANK